MQPLAHALTKRHHPAEAADVGVELLNAPDQLIARVDVHAGVLVAQAATVRCCSGPAAAAAEGLPPPTAPVPLPLRGYCHRTGATVDAAAAASAGAPCSTHQLNGRELHGGRLL